MAKPIEDKGHLIEATRPLKIKRYELGRLPDPGQCVDCLIIINDRSDGTPRGRLAMSNGASWDHLAWLDEIKPSAAVAVRPADIDLQPMIQEAVRQALPAVVHQPPMKLIQASPNEPSEAYKAMAQAVLEMSEHVNRLQFESAELRAEVEFLKKHAVAKVDVRAG